MLGKAGKVFMQSFCQFPVSDVRSLGSFETTAAVKFAAKTNCRSEFSKMFFEPNAFIAGGIVFSLPFILVVLQRCCWADIGPAIVSFFLIFMIQFARRPLASNPYPNQPMGEIPDPVDVYSSMAGFGDGACNIAAFYPRGRSLFPTHNACAPVVVEQGTNQARRQVASSVAMTAHALLSGADSFKKSENGVAIGITQAPLGQFAKFADCDLGVFFGVVGAYRHCTPNFSANALAVFAVVGHFISSRFSSIIRRSRSDTVIPNSLARFCSHFIWGSVKTTDCLVLMGTYKAPFDLSVKVP